VEDFGPAVAPVEHMVTIATQIGPCSSRHRPIFRLAGPARKAKVIVNVPFVFPVCFSPFVFPVCFSFFKKELRPLFLLPSSFPPSLS
jgi:hypothetical protein